VSDRYFSATALGQRLYVDGVSENGDWDPGRLVFYSAEVVSILLKPRPQDRQVHTVQELQAAAEESGLPAYRVYIHEALLEASRQIWRKSRLQTRASQPTSQT
jgi:hypothetical protein